MDESRVKSSKKTFFIRFSENTQPKRIGKHDSHLPISIVSGLIGMLIGTLPAAIWSLIFHYTFSPLFLLLPLCIYQSLVFFKGYKEKRGFIVTGVFSVLGIYLTLLSCNAAEYVIKYKMSFLELPLVTTLLIGKTDVLIGPFFSSAYIFPVLFTVIGVLMTNELLRQKIVPAVVPEPDSNDDILDDEDSRHT